MITGNTPQHLVVAARTGFLTGARMPNMPWRQVATELNMDAAKIQLVDLGTAPMPKESGTGVTVQDFIEKSKEVTAKSWDITVWISQDAIDDDQTASLETKVRGAGQRFQEHINKRVFEVLNAGDDGSALCYDGQDFFDSDHVDSGANNQTAQDNENVVNLSIDNFEVVYNLAQLTKDDQGEFTEFNYDLLVAHPNNRRIAHNIVDNPATGTGDLEQNPYSGLLKPPILTPHIDTTAWYAIASSEQHKPLIVAMKKQPHLQASWFVPDAPDGGLHYFKFYARYAVHYGDWRLAYQGQT